MGGGGGGGNGDIASYNVWKKWVKSQIIKVVILNIYLYKELKQGYDVFMLFFFVKCGSKCISLGSRKFYNLLQLC